MCGPNLFPKYLMNGSEYHAGQIDSTRVWTEHNIGVTFTNGSDTSLSPDIFSKGFPAQGDYLVWHTEYDISWIPKLQFESEYTLISE